MPLKKLWGYIVQDEFFIQLEDNTIIGPFERSRVLDYLKSGRLQLTTLLSHDKLNWQPLQKALNLVVINNEAIPPESPCPHLSNEEPGPQIDSPVDIPAASVPQTAERSFIRILADTMSAGGDAGTYLQKILRCGNFNAVIISSLLSVVIAAAAVILGCILFGSRYNLPLAQIILRTLTAVLLAGGFFWLINAIVRRIAARRGTGCAEADFLSAMYGMMNISFALLVLNSSLFIFNSALCSADTVQKSLLLIVALPLALFFIFNAMLAMRVNFMYNARLSPAAAGFAAAAQTNMVIILCILIQQGVYF